MKYFTRYMDDCIILCKDKEYLKQCLEEMKSYIEEDITRSIASYKGHLKHGHTYRLRQRVFHDFVLTKEKDREENML